MQAFLGVPRDAITFHGHNAWFPGDLITAAVYLALANEANWCDSVAPLPRQQVALKMGQLCLGQRPFAKAMGLSYQSLRTSLSKLEQRGKINALSNAHGTIITIIDYDKIFLPQEDDQRTDQRTSNAPATHQQRNQDIETKRHRDKKKRADALSSAAPTTPPQIAKLWNEHHDWMPRVTDLSEKRKAAIRRRWAGKPDEAYWRDIIQRLAKSSFAKTGGWATFDWLIKNDTNHTKVAEGNYDDRGDQAGGKPKITKLHAGMFPE